MRQARNFVMRLSINYIVLSILLMLAGWGMQERQLFSTWIAAFVFTLLTVTLRRFLLALSLSLIIMTMGLFIFVIDGVILALTAAFTNLRVANVWWVLAGVLVMSIANIWVEKAFWAVGWFRQNNVDGLNTEDNVLTKHAASWIVRLLFFVILLGGIVFSAAMAAQIFLAVGQFTRSMPVITAVAGVFFGLFVFGISWLVAEGLAVDRRALFSGIISVLASIMVMTPVTLLLFAPAPSYETPDPKIRPETAFWELSTGSRIAYSFFPSQEDAGRNPIIFVHGGLGRAVLDADITFFRGFASDGFDVYLYDLVGTGLSGRLDDIREYTVERHAQDLEQIRETIKADRLILVAHAEGSEIAIRYMNQHKDRVERVVFYSPTAMWNDRNYFENDIRTAAMIIPVDALVAVREIVALALGLYSPKTAQAYVSQAEMTMWADLSANEGRMVCIGDGELAPTPKSPGYNAYVGLMGDVSDDYPPDPRERLREIFIPTILLRGECDHIDWGVVQQYYEAVPNIQIYYVENAGSLLHLSQPELVRALILTFLRDGVMPIEPLSDVAINTAMPILDEVR